MVTKSWVNIGSGNGLLPDGTKPLPETMLIYHQQVSSDIYLTAIFLHCLPIGILCPYFTEGSSAQQMENYPWLQ